jgi:hypothetical protein
MRFIQCQASEGPRDGFKTVKVRTVEGYDECLTIEDRFLAQRDDDFFLPVIPVGQDKNQQMALVHLPVEADSGARRVWVYEADLIDDPNRVPA